MDGGEDQGFAESEAAENRQVIRISSDADLQTACLGQFSLCLLSFVDSESDLGRKRRINKECSLERFPPLIWCRSFLFRLCACAVVLSW